MTDVGVHLDRGGHPVAAGVAHFTRERQSVTTTFTYEPGYIAEGTSRRIDPALPLFTGNQYISSMPGAFADSAPDRWGRNLLVRRERQRARAEGRTPRTLDSVDFLLGVNDETRQGDLRYSVADGAFLSPKTDVPRLVELPALLRASDEVVADDDGSEAYKILLAAGTASLGGARPKASVRLDDGALAIAKFPHVNDDWDVMAWEAVALEVAERAGIDAPARRLLRVGDRHVLLIRRFDRSGGARIGYMSAMTMLELDDGAAADYVDISERLADESASLVQDRAELFDRVVMNVALHNTDDHLRNHGLLAGRGGWRLSPVFDINPNPESAEARSTAIAGATEIADEWDGLRALAEASGIGGEQVRERVLRVAGAAAGWPGIADGFGIPAAEQRRLGGAMDARIRSLAQAAEALPLAPTGVATRGKSTPRSNAGSFTKKA